MNSGIDILYYENQTECDNVLAKRIVDDIRADLAQHDQASIAFSGGRTPATLLTKLARQDLDWSKVTITLVDERWVPISHSDSNAKLVNDCLLTALDSNPNFIAHYNSATSPTEAERILNNRLKFLEGRPFSAVVLGVGPDGHTASFFTRSLQYDNCWTSNQSCCYVTNVPESFEHDRMTLTASRLSNSKNVYLQAKGPAKLKVLKSGQLHLPIHRFAAQKKIIAIYCPD